MGIYGALATAVTGLRAQAFALENISGNIANSQTTGYKRIETSFIDLIPDAPLKQQIPGAVVAQSRSTNSEKGDVVSASSDTYMALNGSGFFVVEQKIGQNDGSAVFGGGNYYTRRGDFDVDREGYLVNGAGYYLKGLQIDSTTGNISGSVPEVVQLSTAFLPAQQTNRINYQVNLPQSPKTGNYDPAQANSEIFDAANYMTVAADVTATATGATATFSPGDAANAVFPNGDFLSITADGVTRTYGFDDTAANVGTADLWFDTDDGPTDTLTEILADIQTDLQAQGGAFATATVGITGGPPGQIEITLGTNTTDSITIGGAGGPTSIGMAAGPFDPIDQSLLVRVNQIQASDNDQFIADSLGGGAITVYASNGSPVDVTFRWAKINSPGLTGPDRWNLFYRMDGNATGSDPMWQNSNQDYEFNAAGTLTPNVASVVLSNLEINGVAIGNVTLQHTVGDVTQFDSPTVSASLAQNGYTAGEYLSVTVNDAGRIVASYSNGEQVELAQIVVANFNAPNSLKRLDGGLFAATSESGEANLDSNGGGILGGSLESSNTDISEEFTKLIVTQQAYAAGTRIVSTADEMLQEALNMIR